MALFAELKESSPGARAGAAHNELIGEQHKGERNTLSDKVSRAIAVSPQFFLSLLGARYERIIRARSGRTREVH